MAHRLPTDRGGRDSRGQFELASGYVLIDAIYAEALAS